MAVEVAEKLITPEVAKGYLAANRGNRRVRRSVVQRYAADMQAGQWHLGTGAIVVDVNGVLIDGQHRLLACIEADAAFPCVVFEGVDPAAKAGIDQGAKRSLSDVLSWKGEVNATNLAAAVRVGWTWSNGDPFNRHRVPSVDETLDWLDRNPSIRSAVIDAQPCRRQFYCPLAVVAATLHRLRLVDAAGADEFLEQVETGANLPVGAPALALRNWMTGQAASATTGRRPLPPVYHFVWVKAWNYFVLGREAKIVRFIKRESFPEVLDSVGNPVKMLDELDAA